MATAPKKQIRIAAIMHDCGKRYIPKGIKDKPNELTIEEMEVMKTHTKLGHEMLKNVQGDLGVVARNIALHHHEHWRGDGGYWGVPAHTLPLYVNIVSICDVFCGLIYERPYKPAWPLGEALKYIKSKAGTQFCPELTRTFISIVRSNKSVAALFSGVIS